MDVYIMCFPYYRNPGWGDDSLSEPYPVHPHIHQTKEELLILINLREDSIQKALPGCKFVVKWECEWEIDLVNNSELKTLVKNNPVQNRLDSREALFGRRTNASKLYVDCQEEVKEKTQKCVS